MNGLSIRAHARNRGVSLIFALIALAAISLAAVALVRAVHGNALVIGNVGFKQDTTRAADRAAETAREWLKNGGNDLSTNGVTGTGYYATAHTNIDPTGQRTSASKKMDLIAWEGTSCSCPNSVCNSCLRPSAEFDVSGGNVRAQYLITRLCPGTGAVSDSNACAQPVSVADKNCMNNGAPDYPPPLCEKAEVAPFYRVIVRTVGGRNTVSYTETIVH